MAAHWSSSTPPSLNDLEIVAFMTSEKELLAPVMEYPDFACPCRGGEAKVGRMPKADRNTICALTPFSD